MNRTQKEALWCLLTGLLILPLLAYGFYKLFILKERSTDLERFLLLTVFILVLGTILALLVWVFKGQSPKEPEADERDKQIKARAAMSAFIAACFILPVVSVIPRLIIGDNGCIPAWSLPFIMFGALLIPGTIYWIAVLIQYGCRAKGD